MSLIPLTHYLSGNGYKYSIYFLCRYGEKATYKIILELRDPDVINYIHEDILKLGYTNTWEKYEGVLIDYFKIMVEVIRNE